jgi:hypothetical protein
MLLVYDAALGGMFKNDHEKHIFRGMEAWLQ